LSDAVVDEYAQAMLDGITFPPVDVYYDGTEYWLADGFHRVRAAQKADVAEVAAQVHQGTVQDAQWHSFGANKAHGLQRTNEDKEKTVRAALRHPKAVGLSDRELSRHLGLHHQTVGRYRGEMESTGEIRQSTERTGGDGRTINTANIGTNQRFKLPSMKRPGGNSPRPMRATHGPDSPVPMLSISLPLGNPQQGAGSMFERFNHDYLRLLVRELRNLLEGNTNDQQ
jgi:hypothetical protein